MQKGKGKVMVYNLFVNIHTAFPPPVSEKQVMIGKHCLTPVQFCFYVENTGFVVSGSLAHKMKMCSSEHIFLTALCSKVGGPWLLLFQ